MAGAQGFAGDIAGRIGEFGRYFLASGVGFAVDFAGLAAGVEIFGLPLLIANAISFSAGVVVVYFVSIFWVFETRRLTDAKAEFAIFFLLGAVGLIANQLALWTVVTATDAPYMVGKVAAAAASFIANFLCRKWMLFK